MLDKVSQYDPNIPKGKFGFLSVRWSLLFIFDFVFSLSKKRDADGELIKRYKSEGYPGKAFRRIDVALKKRLIERNKVACNQPLDIPNIESQDFHKKFFNFWRNKINMPIVVKGYLNKAEVMEATSINSLVTDHGEMEVQYVDPDKVKKDANRVGQNMGVSTTTLKEYLTEEDHKQHYVNNFYGILSDQDYLDKCRGSEVNDIRGQKSLLSQWFISRAKTSGSSLHCASGDNMFLNVHGNKEWFFIDPSYMPMLRPALSKYAVYCVAELQEELGIEADFYEELIKDYPYLKHVPVFRVMLEPGDMLFNPSNWWHSVRNHSDYTVGCAVRYISKSPFQNQISVFICLILDALKHPKRSNIPQAIGLARGAVTTKRNFLNNIFSGTISKPV